MRFFNGKCTSTARLDGKTAIITGSNTGIGKITVKDFYKRGARVIMACRNMEKARSSADDVKRECLGQQGLGEIVVVELDLNSLNSVRRCAKQLLETEERINLLINNAGVMVPPLGRTEEGFETQFGTNHLGHFLFTLLLLPKIVKSTPARIVNVSSIAHLSGVIDFDDLNWEKRQYSPSKAYGQSKLANILFTRELARRIEEHQITNLTVYSLHPGVIDTELSRHIDNVYCRGLGTVYRVIGKFFIKTPEQGAQTQIYCAVDEKAGQETGLYYEDCEATKPSARARDDAVAKKLWEVSVKLVDLDENYDPFIV